MTRIRKQAAIATVVALGAAGVVTFFVVRDTGEPSSETSTVAQGTPTQTPLDSTVEPSPESSITNEQDAVESGPGSGAATPTPLSSVSLCPFLPSGSDPGSPTDISGKTADEAVASIPVLSVFSAAMSASGFDAVIQKARGVTILAPTDDAFAADILEDELEELLIERHGELVHLLERHVIGRQRPMSSLVDTGRATARSGHTLTFVADRASVRIDDDANVTCSDLDAATATIHIIDSVLGRIQLTVPQEELG